MSEEKELDAGHDLQEGTRRSNRAVPKPNFKALDSGDEVHEDFTSESDEDESYRTKRKGRRLTKPKHNSRPRQRRTAAIDELEIAAKEAEADVAALVPQAEAWKQRYEELAAENENLKKRVEQLMNEAALRGNGDASVAARTSGAVTAMNVDEQQL